MTTLTDERKRVIGQALKDKDLPRLINFTALQEEFKEHDGRVTETVKYCLQELGAYHNKDGIISYEDIEFFTNEIKEQVMKSSISKMYKQPIIEVVDYCVHRIESRIQKNIKEM